MLENTIKNSSSTVIVEDDSSFVKIRQNLFKYLSHWYLFFLFMGLAFGIAYIYLKYTNPVYKATGTLLLVKDDKGGGVDKDMIDALINGRPKVNVQDEIELIKSRYLLNRVVENNNLDVSVESIGRIKTSDLSAPFPFTLVRVDSLTDTTRNIQFSLIFHQIDQFKVAESSTNLSYNKIFSIGFHSFKLLPNYPVQPELNRRYDIKVLNIISAASAIAGNIKIVPKSTLSRVVELTYTGTNTYKTEYILQKVMEEYLQLGVDEKKKVQRSTLTFINERLNVLSGELGSVEGKLENFRTSNNVIDVTSQSQQFLTDASGNIKDLSLLLIKKQMISYLIDYLDNKENLFNLAPTNLGIEDPVLLSLSQNYNTLLLERQRELTLNTNISPIIRNLDATIEKTRLSLLENLKIVKSNNDLVIQQSRSENNKVQSEISRVPGKERALGGIMRQEKIKNDLFSYLLQKREETEIALAGAYTEAKILNSALVSTMPISPNRRTIWLVALLLGTAIPLLLIWLRDLMNNKVNTKQDIARQVHAPLLGEIGHNDEKHTIVVKPASREIIGEQFRNIRSSINFLIPFKKNFLVLLTSTNAGEGKSFTSINLAATYAITGKRTIVVEMDLRKPKMARYLGLEAQGGITDCLVNNNQLSKFIKNIPGYDNLFLLPAGSIPPNPAELIMSNGMRELIEALKKDYEVILFDCPPVGLVSDAYIIAPYVDLSVYIIRQRVTQKSQLSFINEIYDTKRLNNMGIIVNDVLVTGYYGYYGYGSQSYGYGYGYGYGVSKNKNDNGYFEKSDKKKNWFQRNVPRA